MHRSLGRRLALLEQRAGIDATLPVRERGEVAVLHMLVNCFTAAEVARFQEIALQEQHYAEVDQLLDTVRARLFEHFTDHEPPENPAALVAWADTWERRTFEWVPPGRVDMLDQYTPVQQERVNAARRLRAEDF